MKTIAPLLFVILTIGSCEKEKAIEVFAGRTENMRYHNFEPDINISPRLNPKDSVDLNNDGNYDLGFVYKAVPMPTGFASVLVVQPKNNVQIIISEVDQLPDTLNFGDPIAGKNNWSKIDTDVVFVSSKKLAENIFVPVGSWMDIPAILTPLSGDVDPLQG